MALVTKIIILLVLISAISSLRFEPHTGGGMIFFSNHDSIRKKLSDFEDWKGILGTGKDFGDRNRTCKFDQIL